MASYIKAMAKYKDIGKLGSGGFGEVWRVERETDNEAFAKKVLLDTSPEAVKRFQREVRILSKLDHPRIVKVVDTHLNNEPFWYLMPIYQRSLRGEFPAIVGDTQRIVNIISEILEGMQYAHEQGVIHRDLKPENILLNDDGDLVISDFGLGRAIDAKTTRATYTGEALGTLGYLAPEQAVSGKSADHRSDIYTIGRMIYEMFSGQSMLAIQDLTLLPVGIATIVDKSTKTDPDRRFQTMEELRLAFLSIVSTTGGQLPDERVKELLSQALVNGSLNGAEATELADVLAKVQDDTDLLHDVCMQLPGTAVTALWTANAVVTEVVIRRFVEQITSQGWGFDYTDEISGACVKLHNAIDAAEIRALLIMALLEVGGSHNRWHVMDLAASLVQATTESREALIVAHMLERAGDLVNALQGRVNLRTLNPAIREVLLRKGFE